MSKDLIVRLREAAAQRVASTAMIGADDLISVADALEIATAGMNAYCDELGSCRNAAGFGSADDPMAQEGFDAFGDPLCVAAFVESQFKRIVAERDSLAAELKALREQEPVAWYCDIEDWGREYNGMPGISNGAIGTPLYARPVPAEPSPESIACRSAGMDDWEEAMWRLANTFASHMIAAEKAGVLPAGTDATCQAMTKLVEHLKTRRPAPAHRLTDEMISHLYDQAGFDTNEMREAADHFAHAIESALFG